MSKEENTNKPIDKDRIFKCKFTGEQLAVIHVALGYVPITLNDPKLTILIETQAKVKQILESLQIS